MTDAFLKAVEEVKLLKQKPDHAVLGEVYGLYKQATVGDVNTERPGVLDMAGRGKWAAWHKQKGMSREDAMAAYVELVEQLMARDGS